MHWSVYKYGIEYGWIFVIVVTVAITFGIIHLINLLSARNDATRKGESPIDLIRNRYAKGEITKEQFGAMTHDFLHEMNVTQKERCPEGKKR